MISIDSDPEFFHGLTFWGINSSAQIMEASTLDAETRQYELVVHDLETTNDVHLPADDARRLRDLLNLATARGFL